MSTYSSGRSLSLLLKYQVTLRSSTFPAPVTVAARDQPSGGNGERAAKRSARCVAKERNEGRNSRSRKSVFLIQVRGLTARSTGRSSAIIATMQLPQTSAHARRWASTSFKDHPSWLGGVYN